MKKIAVIVSVILLFGILSYLYYLYQQDFNLTEESPRRESLEIWASTPAILDLAKQFEQQNETVQINIRYFYNHDFLIEELSGAVSAGNPPDIAEMGAAYGIYPLVDAGEILDLSKALPEAMISDLISGIASRFEYGTSLWAWPLGYSIPVVYYNQTLMSNNGVTIETAETWEELWDRGLALKERVESIKPSFWGFHTDLQTPWYLLTLLKQSGSTQDEAIDVEQIGRELLTEWEKVVYEYKLMPPLTHQLAITQFIDGQGAILLSSSEKLAVLEKLIAGKFELGLRAIPRSYSWGPKGYIADGRGLVVFKSGVQQEQNAITFLQYLVEAEQAVQFSLATNYIPAQRSVLDESESYQKYLKLHPSYQSIVEESKQTQRSPITPYDEQIWNRLQQIQEQIESEVPVTTRILSNG